MHAFRAAVEARAISTPLPTCWPMTLRFHEPGGVRAL